MKLRNIVLRIYGLSASLFLDIPWFHVSTTNGTADLDNSEYIAERIKSTTGT